MLRNFKFYQTFKPPPSQNFSKSLKTNLKTNFHLILVKKIKRGDPYKKYELKFFFLKIIKKCKNIVFKQFVAVSEEIFFLRFGKKKPLESLWYSI